MLKEVFTNRKAIAQVRDLIADLDGKIATSSAWSPKLILDRLYKNRAAILQQKIEAGKEISQHNIQTIPQIQLSKVDKNDHVPCAPPTNCIWARTKLCIPPYLKIISVTSIDGSIKYDPINWTNVKYLQYSFFPGESKRPKYTMKTVGDEVSLYLLNDKHKKFVTVTGIFTDPRQVQIFPDCEGNYPICVNMLNLPFVIDPDLESLVFDSTINSLKAGRAGAAYDIYDNEKEDFTRPPIK